MIQNEPMITMIAPTTSAILPTSESNIGCEIVAAGEDEREEHEDRERREDVARDPGLRGQHLDEAPELHPAADDLDDAVENLGGVTAGLALEPHDERDLLGVVALPCAAP